MKNKIATNYTNERLNSKTIPPCPRQRGTSNTFIFTTTLKLKDGCLSSSGGGVPLCGTEVVSVRV